MTLVARGGRSAGLATVSTCILVFVCCRGEAFAASPAADLREQVSQHEASGDLAGAQTLLKRQAAAPGNSAAAQQLAEFLDRHRSQDAREAYLRWAAAESDPAKKRAAYRQVVLDDMSTGQTTDLAQDLAKYKESGATDFAAPTRSKAPAYSTVLIPGPLPSFARMAALSPDLAPEDLLPSLARNVVTNGFQASGNELLVPTEYLRLITRYLNQARELQALANKDRKIVVPSCDSSETGELLKVLGYRMRGTCGADIVLETVNATRAFLTVDSGFPLTKLEGDLRANHPFELAYGPTSVPLLYDVQYWSAALSARNRQGDFVDSLLSDPSLCRLYLGLSHLDRETAAAIRKQTPAAKLKIYAHVLDFYGGMFQVRNGVAVVPGSPKAWASLAGASPNHPGAFFERLMATDDGWLASYYDALSRIDGPTAEYLTAPERMRRFYEALRGRVTSPGPARPVFRSSTELMLLTSSLRIDPNGQPHMPGSVDVWRSLFVKHPHGKYDGKLTRAAAGWKTDDDVLEALFGLSRKTVENEPLRMFLALSDIDRDRARPMSSQLASRLVSNYRTLGDQYVLFAETPAMTEASIAHYLDLCGQVKSMHNTLLRADTLGSLQALVELWRIFSRENTIPAGQQDEAFVKLIGPFESVSNDVQLFDASRAGTEMLLAAAHGQGAGSRQERMMELLVGQVRNEGGGVVSPAENFARIFDAQTLVSLDSLFALADRLANKPADAKAIKAMNEQLNRLSEAESFKGSLSAQEKNSYSTGYWSERHIDGEKKLDISDLIKSAEKKEARGALAPLLRDTLVGFVYCYYAPPGAQILLTNPVFVRSHDFIGPEGLPAEWRGTEVSGLGWPASSGGRLTGSLISLPYALADAEQNFLMPKREQALIWSDLVPQMIVDITVNRWRGVTEDQLRWVSLHVQRGRDLLTATTLNPALEPQVMLALGRFEPPARVQETMDLLREGDVSRALSEVPPQVLYEIAEDPALQRVAPDLPGEQLAALAAQRNPALSAAAISHVFGTPKPTLTHSYRPELLELRTFPSLMGYSSRVLAESWQSNNLYYAVLADETGVPVERLDAYVPVWNRSTIENIFATHLEDWPAILRSLQTVGNEVRQHDKPALALARNQ